MGKLKGKVSRLPFSLKGHGDGLRCRQADPFCPERALFADTFLVVQVLVTAQLSVGLQGNGQQLGRQFCGLGKGDVGLTLTAATTFEAGENGQYPAGKGLRQLARAGGERSGGQDGGDPDADADGGPACAPEPADPAGNIGAPVDPGEDFFGADIAAAIPVTGEEDTGDYGMMFRAVHGDGGVAADKLEQGDHVLFPGAGADGADSLYSLLLMTLITDEVVGLTAGVAQSNAVAKLAAHLPWFGKVVQLLAADHAAGTLAGRLRSGSF